MKKQSRRVICVNEIGRAIGEDSCRAKYTNEEVEAVIRLHEEGYTLRGIASLMDMPVRTIRGYIDGSRRGQQPYAWRTIRKQ